MSLIRRSISRACKGQVAVEYLIIISIVLVVALLAANSALNISGTIGSLVSPKSSKYWQDAQISILAYSVSSDGSVSMLVKNRKPFGISIDYATIGGASVGLEGFSLMPGDEKLLSFQDPAVSGKQGQPYSYPVGFNYTDMQDTAAKYGFFPSFPLNGKYS
ncbi:MAG: class III signal peptide-containing protein [Candidatus Micrarchaeia archaeon]